MSQNDKKEDILNNIQAAVQDFLGTEEHTANYKEKDRTDNRYMAMLSYILPPIPFIAERHSGYVKFHSNQGMNLLIWYLIMCAFIWILDVAFTFDSIINLIRIIVNIVLVALMAFGIINTLNDKAKELPIISKVNIMTVICDLFGLN